MGTFYKLIGALLLTVLFVPGVSFAQTTSVASLQAEINTLLAKVQQLESQLAAAGGSANAVWCYSFNTNLSFGMSGSAVTALQTTLQKDGESITVNGSFDDQTAAAVTGLQEKYASTILTPNGLSNGTGYAGKATRAKLNSLFGCVGGTNPNPTPTPVQPVSAPTPTRITSNQPAAVNLTVNGQIGTVSLASGSQVTLAWTSGGVRSCIANSNGSWTGSVGTSGTAIATLPSVAASTGVQYTITCAASLGGSLTSAVQVNVQPSTTTNSGSFTISPSVTTAFYQGSNNTISWSGATCAAGMPNSCATFILKNIQGSCANNGGCTIGYVPAPINSPASGSYNWDAKTVCSASAAYSSTQWTGCTTISPNLYEIVSLDANGNSVASGNIWVDAASTTNPNNSSSITIVSPGMSTTWTAGTTQQITWTGKTLTGYFGINLNSLANNGESSITQIAQNLPSTATSFSWTVPGNLATGKYEVQVESASTGAGAVSQPFTITASTVSPSLAASGRDARRISDLHGIQNALELYYNKCVFYPGMVNCGISAPISWPALTAALVNSNIGLSVASIPNDPLGGSATYAYGVTGDGSKYLLEATLESSSSISTFGGSNYVPPTIPAGMTWTISPAPTCSGLQYCINL